MTITRVVRDDVEFFTIDATGESGMSESGLARLCGVTPMAVNKVLRNQLYTWEQDGSLEPRLRKYLSFKPTDQRKITECQFLNIKILSGELCARIIQYYAFESKHKTEEALVAFQKFAAKGITSWIQQITHWHGNTLPKAGIAVDFKTIDTLMDKRLDGSSYRVYLVLQRAIRLRMTMTAEEIMERTGMSRSAYSTAVTKLDTLGLLPDWCRIQRRQQPEKIVRDRLQAKLGGRTESPTPWGPIDLLTETELIEVKGIKQWKEAIGHILVKSEAHPHHEKRLHLYGPNSTNLDQIRSACTNLDILVTFELVTKPEESSIVSP
jgi:hypothetical protein